MYKAGQARVYLVGSRDKEVINEAFDKLHEERTYGVNYHCYTILFPLLFDMEVNPRRT